MLLPSPLDSIGHVTVHYDRVTIAAKASKANLLRVLPMGPLLTGSSSCILLATCTSAPISSAIAIRPLRPPITSIQCLAR